MNNLDRPGNFWAPVYPDNPTELKRCHHEVMVAKNCLSRIEKATKLIQEDELTLTTLEAKFEMAERYRWGLGVQVDPKKSLELYISASEAGHAKAAYEIATSYADKKTKRLDIYRNIPMARKIIKDALLAAENLDFKQPDEDIEDLKALKRVVDLYIKNPKFVDM